MRLSSSASKRSPDAQALSFFLSADRLDETHVWTYAELVADVTRAANVFRRPRRRGRPPRGLCPAQPSRDPLRDLGRRSRRRGARGQPDARTETGRGHPALRPRFDPRHARSGFEPEGVVRSRRELASLPDLSAIAFVDMADYLDGEKREAARASIEEAAAGTQLKVVNLREAMREQPSDRLVPPRTIKADDISSYFCTGGTTGAPKIAVRTHRNEVFDCLGRFEGDGDRRLARNRPLRLALVPRERSARHRTSAMDARRPCRHRHARRLSGKERHRPILGDRRSRYRVTMFSGVPTLYAALMQTPVGDSDISSLRFAVCGAAPMPAALIRAFEAKTGVKILEGYGLTEGACVSSVNPAAGERRAGSIGLPIPYQRMEAVILDGDGRFQRIAERRRGRRHRDQRAQCLQGLSRPPP